MVTIVANLALIVNNDFKLSASILFELKNLPYIFLLPNGFKQKDFCALNQFFAVHCSDCPMHHLWRDLDARCPEYCVPQSTPKFSQYELF